MSVASELGNWLEMQIAVAENIATSAPVGTPLFERDHMKRRAEVLHEVRVILNAIAAHYGGR